MSFMLLLPKVEPCLQLCDWRNQSISVVPLVFRFLDRYTNFSEVVISRVPQASGLRLDVVRNVDCMWFRAVVDAGGTVHPSLRNETSNSVATGARISARSRYLRLASGVSIPVSRCCGHRLVSSLWTDVVKTMMTCVFTRD